MTMLIMVAPPVAPPVAAAPVATTKTWDNPPQWLQDWGNGMRAGPTSSISVKWGQLGGGPPIYATWTPKPPVKVAEAAAAANPAAATKAATAISPATEASISFGAAALAFSAAKSSVL